MKPIVGRACCGGRGAHGHDLHPAAVGAASACDRRGISRRSFYAAGTHPMSAADEPLGDIGRAGYAGRSPQVRRVSVRRGSTITTPPKALHIQQDSLRVHIAAARDTKLPLIIHARAADDDMARILREELDKGAL